jgi:hypothetical protein
MCTCATFTLTSILQYACIYILVSIHLHLHLIYNDVYFHTYIYISINKLITSQWYLHTCLDLHLYHLNLNNGLPRPSTSVDRNTVGGVPNSLCAKEPHTKLPTEPSAQPPNHPSIQREVLNGYVCICTHTQYEEGKERWWWEPFKRVYFWGNIFLSFFLSWVSKTQPNHWTKRMASTQLAT